MADLRIARSAVGENTGIEPCFGPLMPQRRTWGVSGGPAKVLMSGVFVLGFLALVGLLQLFL